MSAAPTGWETAAAGGALGVAGKGKKTHFCSSCNFPAATSARCAPCLHVFCLACASTMATCLICSSQLTKIELLPAGAPLFVSPATLQGYRTEADFGKHMQTVAERLGSSSR